MTTLVLRAEDGTLLPLDPERWHADADAIEEELLGTATGPVLDVGCGPGRLVVALRRRGIPALGVDPAPAAVHLARRRGATVLQRSVFDALPGEGRWLTLLLIDGNIGIGGDPVRLLRRCRSLVAADGIIVAEIEPPGRDSGTYRVRLEKGAWRGEWFAWAVIGVDGLAAMVAAAGLAMGDLHSRGGRWFATLRLAESGRYALSA